MGHDGFREVVLLAKNGVPWSTAMTWSEARRRAALAIVREHNEGQQ